MSAVEDVHLADFPSIFFFCLGGKKIKKNQKKSYSTLENNHELLSLQQPITPRQGVLELNVPRRKPSYCY